VLFSGPAISKFADYPANDRQLTRIVAPPAYAGAAQQVQEFQYDAAGNLTRSIAPNGAQTNYSYDAMGNVTLVDNPVGTDVTRWYDAGNRVTMEQAYGSAVDYDTVAQYITYAYDNQGRLRYRVGPDGRVTEYRLYGNGTVYRKLEYTADFYTPGVAITEAGMDAWRNALPDKSRASNTTYGYDIHGNLIWEFNHTVLDANGNELPSPDQTGSVRIYDHLGRLLTISKFGENQQSYVYDGLGRLVASSDETGSVTSVFFDDANLRTVMHFSNGLNRTLTYNKAGDLVSDVESSLGTQSSPALPP
jgi:YD repeat-containing protein